MKPDEIRSEIERRRQRAKDLGLREKMWGLYYGKLGTYADKLQNDPDLILPEIRDGLEVSGKENIKFCFNGVWYRLAYIEKSRSSDSDYSVGRRRRFGGTQTTNCGIAFDVITDNCEDSRVFDFDFCRTVEDTPDMPIFRESMGEVNAFIDGQWVVVVAELSDLIAAHERRIRERRNAPKTEAKLKEDMKRFGL